MVTEGSSWKILFSLMNRALSWEESPLDSRGSGGNNAVFVQRMCKDAKRVWGFGVSNKGSSPEPTPWEGWRRSGNPKAPKVDSLEHWATRPLESTPVLLGSLSLQSLKACGLSVCLEKSQISLLPDFLEGAGWTGSLSN